MTDPADIPARPPSYGRVSLGVVMSRREANLLGNKIEAARSRS
jgi:hypothetical protein